VGSGGIVVILERDRACMYGLITSITDKRCFANASALFKFKAVTNFITGMAGAAKGITENEFFTSVFLATLKPVDAKVVWIIKTTPVPRICNSVFKHLIRNGRWIFAEVFGDRSEGFIFV
jgi:hypothetical protein